MKAKTLFSLLIGLTFYSAQAQEFNSSKEDFSRMSDYLAAGTGKWMAPSPNYDASNPRSSKALGLWFEKRLNGNLLHLSIISYRSDTAFVISEGFWLWHPGEKRMNYLDISLRGNFIDGETYFTNDSTFVTRNFTYFTDGSVRFARGMNYMLTEDTHETASFAYENGAWKERARFKWKLTEENEGYKVIQHIK